jgi:3-isopropylmalate/(R)-2-methylmalate dehydratase small subunit
MKAAEAGANATMTVDLEKQEIIDPDGGVIPFDVEDFRKHCLLGGLDDIGLTMQKAGRIDTFEAAQKASQPWLYT